MQHHVATEHQPMLPPSLWEIPALVRPEYTTPDEVLPGDNVISTDSYAERYLYATEDLHDIMEEHRTLLDGQPKMQILLQKLLEMFQEAAGGSFQALKEVISSGEPTLLGVLDILEDIGIAAESSGKSNEYAELEARLTGLYRQYF